MRWFPRKTEQMPDGVAAADGCRFRSSDSRFEVDIPAVPLRAMVGYASASGWRNETGGILIGRYEDGQRTAVILEVTGPPAGSSWGRTWFRRGAGDINALLERRWREGVYYLGEWHTHPNGAPDPSPDDLRAMLSISVQPSYACPEPILLILGGRSTAWHLNAVIVADGSPVFMTPVRKRHTG